MNDLTAGNIVAAARQPRPDLIEWLHDRRVTIIVGEGKTYIDGEITCRDNRYHVRAFDGKELVFEESFVKLEAAIDALATREERIDQRRADKWNRDNPRAEDLLTEDGL